MRSVVACLFLAVFGARVVDVLACFRQIRRGEVVLDWCSSSATYGGLFHESTMYRRYCYLSFDVVVTFPPPIYIYTYSYIYV